MTQAEKIPQSNEGLNASSALWLMDGSDGWIGLARFKSVMREQLNNATRAEEIAGWSLDESTTTFCITHQDFVLVAAVATAAGRVIEFCVIYRGDNAVDGYTTDEPVKALREYIADPETAAHQARAIIQQAQTAD